MSESLPVCLRCEDSTDLFDFASGGFLIQGPSAVWRIPSESKLCEDCLWEVVEHVEQHGGTHTLGSFGGATA